MGARLPAMKRTAAFLFVLAWCLCVPPLAAASAPSIAYSATDARNQEATLHFSIDPEGLETSYEVMYGKVGESYRPFHEPLDGVLPAGEEPVALEKQLPVFFEAPLQAGTEYHWRVVAKNADGETAGTDQVFTTTAGPTPAFTSVTATQTGPGSVSFTGTVDPEGALLTGCRFRWVDAETFHQAGFEKPAAGEIVRFGQTVPCEESAAEIGSGTDPVTVHGEASGFEPGEYFFRLEGENAYEGATAFGVAFTVSAQPPASGPPGVPAGVEPPGLGKAPGLQKAPGLRKAHRKARARRLHHNATISARR
jgi:hypothetical protein